MVMCCEDYGLINSDLYLDKLVTSFTDYASHMAYK